MITTWNTQTKFIISISEHCTTTKCLVEMYLYPSVRGFLFSLSHSIVLCEVVKTNIEVMSEKTFYYKLARF